MIGVVLGVCVSGVCCGVIAWCTFNKDVRIDLLLTLPNIHLSPPLFLLLPPSSSSFPFHPPPPSPVSYLFYVTTLLRSSSYLFCSTSYPYLPPSTPFCNRFFVLVGMAFLADRRTTKKRAAQKNTLVHLMTTEMGGGGNAGAGSETLRTVRGCEILN